MVEIVVEIMVEIAVKAVVKTGCHTSYLIQWPSAMSEQRSKAYYLIRQLLRYYTLDHRFDIAEAHCIR